MRIFWLWILGFVVVWPIHSRATEVGGKPIDVMLSDILCLIMPLAYPFIVSRSAQTRLASSRLRVRPSIFPAWMALVFIIYSVALAGIGLGTTGELIRVMSAFKLTKPVAFVFL